MEEVVHERGLWCKQDPKWDLGGVSLQHHSMANILLRLPFGAVATPSEFCIASLMPASVVADLWFPCLPKNSRSWRRWEGSRGRLAYWLPCTKVCLNFGHLGWESRRGSSCSAGWNLDPYAMEEPG